MLIRDGGVNIEPVAEVKPSHRSPWIRVDLVGNSEGNAKPPLLIEVKFSADLTSNQPNNYLNWLLADDSESVLVFLVPELQDQVLWPGVERASWQNGTGIVRCRG